MFLYFSTLQKLYYNLGSADKDVSSFILLATNLVNSTSMDILPISLQKAFLKNEEMIVRKGLLQMNQIQEKSGYVCL